MILCRRAFYCFEHCLICQVRHRFERNYTDFFCFYFCYSCYPLLRLLSDFFTVKRDIRNRFIICHLIGVYLTYSLRQIFFHKRSLKLFRQRRFFFVGVDTILFRRRIFSCILRLFHTTIIPVCRYFNRKTTKKRVLCV